MNKNIIIILIIVSGIIYSCAPDQFILNQRKREIINGLIISNIDSVEVIGDNAIQLYGGGHVAMRRSHMTQILADFTVKILQGDGLRFAIRSVSDNFENHPAIFFDYTIKGSKVFEKGKFETIIDSVKAKVNDIKRIKIMNYGKNLFITVDCDTIFNGRTELPATEYILIQALKSTNVQISGIDINKSDEEN